MLRNQWTFPMKVSELVEAVDRLVAQRQQEIDVKTQHRVQMGDDPLILERLERQADLAGFSLTSRDYGTRAKNHDIEALQRQVDEMARIRRGLVRQDPHRMLKLNLDDLKFFEL